MSKYRVKYREGARYEGCVAGPFTTEEAAERFIVAIANSGKCHGAEIIPESKYQDSLGQNYFTIQLPYSFWHLRQLSSEDLTYLFEKAKHLTELYISQQNDLLMPAPNEFYKELKDYFNKHSPVKVLSEPDIDVRVSQTKFMGTDY